MLRFLPLLLFLFSYAEAQTFDLDRLLQDGTLEAFKTEHAIERCDLTARAILLRAETALVAGQSQEALSLGETATQFSPESPPPHFFLARLYFFKANLPAAVQHYSLGLFHGLRDFGFLLSTLGLVLLLALAAFLLSGLVFALCSLFYIGRLWVHEWTERFGVPHRWACGLYLLLVLLPLLLGFPLIWFVIFCFLLSFGFYHHAERGVVILFLVIIGSASWVLPLTASLFMAKNSVLLNQMVQNVQGASPLLPQMPISPVDGRARLLLASHAMHNNAYANAEMLYQEALSKDPNSPLLLNNLGNVYFYLKDYKRALEYYQQALQNSPQPVLVHYNLSQTYREMLLFEEGEKAYAQALSTDREATERYTKRAVRYPAAPVVESRLTRGDLWNEALTHEDAGIGEALFRGWAGGGLAQSLWIALVCAVVLPLSSAVLKPFYTGKPCSICRRPICQRCEQALFGYNTCSECAGQFSGMTQMHLAHLEQARKQVPKIYLPFFLIPGCGQIVLGQTVPGFVFLFLTASLGLLFLSDPLFSSAQWHLRVSPLFLGVGLITLYVVSAFDLIRRAATPPSSR
jgi:tetratricopeptide (TPR) repeat protein